MSIHFSIAAGSARWGFHLDSADGLGLLHYATDTQKEARSLFHDNPGDILGLQMPTLVSVVFTGLQLSLKLDPFQAPEIRVRAMGAARTQKILLNHIKTGQCST